MSRIKLTYYESRVHKSTKVQKKNNQETGLTDVRTKSIVVLPCIFKECRLNKTFYDFGFKSLPEGVENILTRYGFHYDFKLGGWVRRFVGTATHISHIDDIGNKMMEDKYDEEYGYNIALIRAKAKSQMVCAEIMYEIQGLFETMAVVFNNSADHFAKTFSEEAEALSEALGEEVE